MSSGLETGRSIRGPSRPRRSAPRSKKPPPRSANCRRTSSRTRRCSKTRYAKLRRRGVHLLSWRAHQAGIARDRRMPRRVEADAADDGKSATQNSARSCRSRSRPWWPRGCIRFGGATLKDHLRDRMDVPEGRTVKTHVRLYQAMPGARAATIARAEGIRPHDLHPLTPHAAGALLGSMPGWACAIIPRRAFLHSPHRLHVRQRLYYIEPPTGRQHVHQRHHARLARTELLINLRKSEIHIWLFLTERLCQQIATELSKSRNAAASFRLIKPLVHRVARKLREVDARTPPAARAARSQRNARTSRRRSRPGWCRSLITSLPRSMNGRRPASSQYLANQADEFRRISADHHDGVTLTSGLAVFRAWRCCGWRREASLPPAKERRGSTGRRSRHDGGSRATRMRGTSALPHEPADGRPRRCGGRCCARSTIGKVPPNGWTISKRTRCPPPGRGSSAMSG